MTPRARLALLTIALVAGGCGGDSDSATVSRSADDRRVRDAAVRIYTTRDPAVCRTGALRTFIAKTITSGGPGGVRRAIRACQRNRRAGRVLERGDVDVRRVDVEGHAATAYVAVRGGPGGRSCSVLRLDELSGRWRVGSLDAVDCARVP